MEKNSNAPRSHIEEKNAQKVLCNTKCHFSTASLLHNSEKSSTLACETEISDSCVLFCCPEVTKD